MVDAATKQALGSLPLLRVAAGPRDDTWTNRLKEELTALIQVSSVDFATRSPTHTAAVHQVQQGARQRLVHA